MKNKLNANENYIENCLMIFFYEMCAQITIFFLENSQSYWFIKKNCHCDKNLKCKSVSSAGIFSENINYDSTQNEVVVINHKKNILGNFGLLSWKKNIS